MKKVLSLALSVILCLCCFISCDSLDGEYITDTSVTEDDTSIASEIADIVIEYEKKLKDKADNLREQNPEYIYFYPEATNIICTYKLEDYDSADKVIEKYDLYNIFPYAHIRNFGDIKTINITVERKYFTESVYQKIKLISEEEPLIKDFSANVTSDFVEIYMPEFKVDESEKIKLPYSAEEHYNPILGAKSVIIRSIDEYEDYIEALMQLSQSDYQKEKIQERKDGYDDSFFEGYALIVTRPVTRTSGSIELDVNEACIVKNNIYVIVRTSVPSVGTGDMKYTSFVIEVPQEDIINIDEVIVVE